MNQQSMDAVMTSQTKEVPEDIVMEIQLRLPVKSLVRFRCVSKHWLSLITDPKFIRLHVKRLRDQHNHLYDDCDNSTTTTTTTTNSSYPQSSVILSYNSNIPVKHGPFKKRIPAESKIQYIGGGYSEGSFEEAVNFDSPLLQGQYFEIKGCCDGLVCLVVERSTIILWNPSIRQHRILPLPPYIKYSHPQSEIFGVGYCSRIDDYKVVRLPSLHCRYDMTGICLLQANVFNLKSNYWTRIQDVPCSISKAQGMPVSAHGGLYWIASPRYYHLTNLILRFDLANETFREIPLPPNIDSVANYRRLGLWGGFVCMLHCYAFWVLKDDGEQGWTKVMTIPKIPAPQDSSFSYFFEPLCLTRSGKVVIVVSRVKFVLYDPREQTVRELHIRGLQDGWFHETLYFESLVSPWGGKPCLSFLWSPNPRNSKKMQQSGSQSSSRSPRKSTAQLEHDPVARSHGKPHSRSPPDDTPNRRMRRQSISKHYSDSHLVVCGEVPNSEIPKATETKQDSGLSPNGNHSGKREFRGDSERYVKRKRHSRSPNPRNSKKMQQSGSQSSSRSPRKSTAQLEHDPVARSHGKSHSRSPPDDTPNRRMRRQSISKHYSDSHLVVCGEVPNSEIPKATETKQDSGLSPNGNHSRKRELRGDSERHVKRKRHSRSPNPRNSKKMQQSGSQSSSRSPLKSTAQLEHDPVARSHRKSHSRSPPDDTLNRRMRRQSFSKHYSDSHRYHNQSPKRLPNRHHPSHRSYSKHSSPKYYGSNTSPRDRISQRYAQSDYRRNSGQRTPPRYSQRDYRSNSRRSRGRSITRKSHHHDKDHSSSSKHEPDPGNEWPNLSENLRAQLGPPPTHDEEPVDWRYNLSEQLRTQLGPRMGEAQAVERELQSRHDPSRSDNRPPKKQKSRSRSKK